MVRTSTAPPVWGLFPFAYSYYILHGLYRARPVCTSAINTRIYMRNNQLYIHYLQVDLFMSSHSEDLVYRSVRSYHYRADEKTRRLPSLAAACPSSATGTKVRAPAQSMPRLSVTHNAAHTVALKSRIGCKRGHCTNTAGETVTMVWNATWQVADHDEHRDQVQSSAAPNAFINNVSEENNEMKKTRGWGGGG